MILFNCRYCELKAQSEVPNGQLIYFERNGMVVEVTDKCTCYKQAEILNNAFTGKKNDIL